MIVVGGLKSWFRAGCFLVDEGGGRGSLNPAPRTLPSHHPLLSVVITLLLHLSTPPHTHPSDSPTQGSPVVGAVRQRLAGIEKEYQELDGVWFMAGSLFNK